MESLSIQLFANQEQSASVDVEYPEKGKKKKEILTGLVLNERIWNLDGRVWNKETTDRRWGSVHCEFLQQRISESNLNVTDIHRRDLLSNFFASHHTEGNRTYAQTSLEISLISEDFDASVQRVGVPYRLTDTRSSW